MCWHGLSCCALAQRARIPDYFEVQPSTGFSQPATIQGPLNAPIFQGAPPNLSQQPPPAMFTNPGNPVVINGPAFDPYSGNNFALPPLPGSQQNPVIPNYGATPPYGNNFSNPGAPPSLSFGDAYTNPNIMQPNIGNGGYNFGDPNGGNFGAGTGTGNPWSNSARAWPSQAWTEMRDKWWPRLIEHPRFRHLWLSGNNGNELGLNEMEVATTLMVPNFLGSNQPLMVSPGFIASFWDGPDTMITGFEMPSATYAPYLSIDAASDFRKNAGIEMNVTLGVYSDYYHVNSDSLRITGTGLGWFKVNPYTTFKGGVEYYDRIRVKMLPAFGFFMQPNSDMKLDLYFPRPRFAHRMPRMGNYEVWGYVGAEYGGGSWTIERMGNIDDQVDVNEIRSFFGYEWVGPKNVTGFLETGYVFDREMLYRSDPTVRLGLQDAWMVRGGLSF